MDVSSIETATATDNAVAGQIGPADWNALLTLLGATAAGLNAAETVTGAWKFTQPLTLARTDGATAATVEIHDPTITGTVGIAVGNVGGTKFGTTFIPTRFTNGPGGEPNYMDDTWHIGMNVGALSGGVGRADTTKPNLVLSWESKFYSGGVFGQEFHVQGVTTDGLTTFRPWTFFASHDATVVEGAIQVDTFRINDKAGNNIAIFSDASNSVDLTTALLRFGTNNLPAIQQKNSGGTMVNLLWLSSGNVAQVEAPINISAARQSSVFATIQPTTANTNDTVLSIAPPAITGTINGVRSVGNITGVLQHLVENTSSTAGAHAREVLQVADSTGGDPYVYMTVPGATNWSFGIDNSDSDRFVFSAASTLGASNALGLTVAGDVQIYKPLVALGGGATPTLGTIGGSGPTTAAQNTWLRLLDSTGAAFWVPAWK